MQRFFVLLGLPDLSWYNKPTWENIPKWQLNTKWPKIYQNVNKNSKWP
jgi:hypothetical protein